MLSRRLILHSLALWPALSLAADPPASPPPSPPSALAGKRIAFLGDSITQAGAYVSFISYFLHKQFPAADFDIFPLGLASETVSGLSEPGHAGGAFPRPCLIERLGRTLATVKPDTVFACYGMNDGIYLPPDPQRLAAFQSGITRLLTDCRNAGVSSLFLITPPIYDAPAPPDKPNYDAVLSAFASWEVSLKDPDLRVIDLHSAMRAARDARKDAFSPDHVHPDDHGHLFMARTILSSLSIPTPDLSPDVIRANPLFKACDQLRQLRWDRWMPHIGYTREKTIPPQPLGSAPADAAAILATINSLRRSP